jgi:polar amino acid transport system substrate-binding protein
MKITKLFCQTALFSLMALGMASHASTLDDIRQAKKVRIAIDLTLPPSGMTDGKMQPTGSDVETARLLAKDLGVAMELVTTTGASRIPNLQTNKADLVISTLSITPERAKVVDFSVPYATNQSVVGAVKKLDLKSTADLAGKSVTVTRGTTQDSNLTKNFKQTTVVRYDDDATMITAAASGQADIVATSVALVNAIKKKNPSREFEVKFVLKNFGFGIGMRKNEPELKEWVDNWVRTNLKNGQLNAIYKKYHGADLPEEILKGGQ